MRFSNWVKKQCKYNLAEIPLHEYGTEYFGSNKDKENIFCARMKHMMTLKQWKEPKNLNGLWKNLGKGEFTHVQEGGVSLFTRWQIEDPRADRDGFTQKDKAYVADACRRIWGWSRAKALCLERAEGPNGLPICENEKCLKEVQKVQVDHITPAGTVDNGYLDRLFCPSSKLQALCKRCHKRKTKHDLKTLIAARKPKPLFTDAF